jgi:hypothetical protein
MKLIWYFLPALILVISYILYMEIDTLDTIELEKESEALCSDGSPYKFELSKGFDEGVNKFLLFFEGGGWCIFNTEGYDFTKCIERQQISWGSSKPLYRKSSKISRLFYILSASQKFNPVFYNWNKIMVRYCDGFGHQGYARDPIVYNGTQEMYLRGYNNTMGIVNYLKTNLNLTDADRLVLAGHSAGGTAALYWANYIKDSLNPKTNVSVIVDSGIFLDVANHNDTQYKMRDNWIKVHNLTHHGDSQFMSSFCNTTTTEPWRCFMPDNLLASIKVPVLMLQSLYDSWSIYRLVGDFCIFEDSRGMLHKCNSTEYIEEYKGKLVQFFNGLKSNRNVYFWLTHCITHSFLYAVQDVFDERVGISGINLQESIELWLEKPEVSQNFVENRIFDIKTCEKVKDLYYYVNYFGYPTS